MAEVNLARRRLLRGRHPGGPLPVRPPWSRDDRFTELCTRCGDCAAACGDGPLVMGEDNFPQIDFARAECSFCGACADACAEPLFLPRDGVLPRDPVLPREGVLPRHLTPWNLVAAIGDGCLAAGGTYCRSCGDACPEGAIRFAVQLGGIAIAGISDADCTGCGACVSTCPVGAVRVAAPARPASALRER